MVRLGDLHVVAGVVVVAGIRSTVPTVLHLPYHRSTMFRDGFCCCSGSSWRTWSCSSSSSYDCLLYAIKYLQIEHVLHLVVVVVEHRVGVGTCRCRRSCWCRETRMHRYPITHVCYDLIVGLLIASIILCRVSQWKATPFPMH